MLSRYIARIFPFLSLSFSFLSSCVLSVQIFHALTANVAQPDARKQTWNILKPYQKTDSLSLKIVIESKKFQPVCM